MKKIIAKTLIALLLISPALAAAQTASTAPGIDASTFTRSLSLGVSGNDVYQLQTFLRAQGFFTYPETTQYFGPITEAAVIAFQTANNVPAIGVVGPLTRAAITQKNTDASGTTSATGTTTTTGTTITTPAVTQTAISHPASSGGKPHHSSSNSDDDTTAPAISSIATSSVTATSISIAWTTDEAADTQVEYGSTNEYGNSSTLDATRVTSHTVSLTGLSSGATYHYRVRSTDSSGNVAYSNDATFTTTQDAYEAGAVHFDGDTSLLLDSLSINPTPYLFMSLWIKESVSDSYADTDYSGLVVADPGVDAAPFLSLAAPVRGFTYGSENVEGGYLFNGYTVPATPNTVDVWNHYVMAADLSSETGDFVIKLYKNGVDVTDPGTADGATGDPGNTRMNGFPLSIGDDGYIGGDAGESHHYEGDMADVYVSSENFFTGDIISDETIAKFRDSDTGKPVNLGEDGSAPTGTAPAVFLHHVQGDAVSDFISNLGTGGDFGVDEGELTQASSDPSNPVSPP